ncbi:MAG: hypothetical protein VX444_01515 [Pseudomonadota bacterium]|nr:hypothetical protein [Pseudomonadota bacterium]
MTSLTHEVKDLFQARSDLLELRKEAARALNTEEWRAYKKVVEKFDGERRFTKRQYELEYPNRVNEVRRRLINEAGSVKRGLVFKRYASDGFNKDEINRRAHMEVRNAHKNDLTRIDQKECEALRPMLENAQARVEQREKPIKDFQKAVDRRSGQDRRVRSWSR